MFDIKIEEELMRHKQTMDILSKGRDALFVVIQIANAEQEGDIRNCYKILFPQDQYSAVAPVEAEERAPVVSAPIKAEERDPVVVAPVEAKEPAPVVAVKERSKYMIKKYGHAAPVEAKESAPVVAAKEKSRYMINKEAAEELIKNTILNKLMSETVKLDIKGEAKLLPENENEFKCYDSRMICRYLTDEKGYDPTKLTSKRVRDFMNQLVDEGQFKSFITADNRYLFRYNGNPKDVSYSDNKSKILAADLMFGSCA
jgi:hypothetical protein